MTQNKSIYAREFNKNSSYWEEDRVINWAFLRAQQAYYNDILRARGYVFLRDIYERLGIPVSKESIVAGWYYDPKDPTAHNHIDFNLPGVSEGPNFVLDFNVDGDISHHF